MSYVLALVMSLIILYYVIKPLLESKYRLAHLSVVQKNGSVSKLQQSKTELLSAIKEIDFEYQMGKLAQDDYDRLKQEYQANAVRVLQEIDKKKGGNDHEADVEDEIRRYRQQMKTGKPAAGGEAKNFCPACGSRVQPEYRFCSQCGEKL